MEIIDRVLELSPKAEISRGEYSTIMDADAKPSSSSSSSGVPLTAEQIAHPRQVSVVLTKATGGLRLKRGGMKVRGWDNMRASRAKGREQGARSRG